MLSGSLLKVFCPVGLKDEMSLPDFREPKQWSKLGPLGLANQILDYSKSHDDEFGLK